MKFKLLLLMTMPFYLVAHATDSNFIISEIDISGLQRIESNTVMSYLPVKVGDLMSPTTSDDIINKLYATGFLMISG